MSERLKIAVQSGRMKEEALGLFEAAGFKFEAGPRDLYISATNAPIDFIPLKGDDTIRYLKEGKFDMGVIGHNTLAEKGPMSDDMQPMALGFGKCHLSIAVPEDSAIRTAQDLEGLRIATSYPNYVRAYLAENGIAAKEIHYMRGSVEVAPRLDVADVICDLVETGTTLKVMKLRELVGPPIMESEALLVVTSQERSSEQNAIIAMVQKRVKTVLDMREAAAAVALPSPAEQLGFMYDLATTMHDRRVNPDPNSKTTQFLNQGFDRIGQKVGEECNEIANEVTKRGPKLADETADLYYRLVLAMEASNVKLGDVLAKVKPAQIIDPVSDAKMDAITDKMAALGVKAMRAITRQEPDIADKLAKVITQSLIVLRANNVAVSDVEAELEGRKTSKPAVPQQPVSRVFPELALVP